MPDVYNVTGYGRMIADRARMDAYARALEAAVRPGSVVLDIGTGTGIFALLACRFGARKVYGVEPGDAIQVAREAARANGFEDRIELIQGVSTEIEPPERADVIVSDLRGVLPPFQQIVPSLVDARERLLAPGGVMIPRADRLLAAPAEAPEKWAKLVGPWDEMSYGFDMGAARRATVNQWSRDLFRAEQMLGEPGEWAVLDYRTVSETDASGWIESTVTREGVGHGLFVWFEADLGDGIGYGTGPGTQSIYQTAFFPWPQAVPLAPGDRVVAKIEARLVGGDYLWRWNTHLERQSGASVDFRQTTFDSGRFPLARLRKRAHNFRPELGEEGEIDAFVLSRMDGRTELGELARELRERFPARFPTWEQALTRVGRLAESYAR